MDVITLSPLAIGLGLFGMLASLALLVGFAYRGWTVLLLAPFAAMLAAAISGEPVLAHWTQTFMLSAARFLAQFFPLFLLGALFGSCRLRSHAPIVTGYALLPKMARGAVPVRISASMKNVAD